MRRLVLALTAVSILLLVGGLAIPRTAPTAMTMGTMDEMMGVGRYQDIGQCDFWVVNMSMPADRIERSFSCGFYWDWSIRDEQGAYIHEALLDHGRGEVFNVPNMDRGNLEEWYHVNGAMLTNDALRFRLPNGTDAGVLMPPPGSSGELTMGWVASGGKRGQTPHLIKARNLTEVGQAEIQGIETRHWTSSFTHHPATWHGYDCSISETVHLWSDPDTGWILKMRRDVTVSMTPGQMAKAQGYSAPLAGGDPQPVMELSYRTVQPGVDKHVEEDRTFRAMMKPIGHATEVTAAGAVGLVVFGAASLHLTTGTEHE